MEIIKLGESSLKISLPKEEAEKYDFINDKNVDYESSVSLRQLLEKAKKEVDFDTRGRVSVEIYVAPKGECEIFISKVKEKSTYKEKTLDTQRKRGQKSIYVFDSIAHLLALCFRLKNNSFSLKSKIYFDYEKGKYYLILFDVDARDLKYSYLTEYSKTIKPVFYNYLKDAKSLLKD